MSVLPCGILLSSYQAKHEWLTHLLLLSHKAVSNSLPPSRSSRHPGKSSSFLPAFSFAQNNGLFHWVSSLYQVAKVLELQLQHQSFQWIFHWKEWSFSKGSISFGLTGFIFQWALKSLLQHHSSKASILWCSAFFMVQLSLSNMTTGKTIALTIWTFVGKVMSLLFSMLSRFVIAFLPRSKHLLIYGCSYHLQWFWSLRR